MRAITSNDICRTAAATLGYEQCKKHIAIPIKRDGNHLVVAMADTASCAAIADITGMYIVPVVFPAQSILAHIEYILAPVQKQSIQNHGQHTRQEIADAPAVRFISIAIEGAIASRASDIHIEPNEGQLRTRYRVDGLLHIANFSNIALHASVVSRLKIMSGMDIAESRRPQDGQFSLAEYEGTDFRLSTLPTTNGEKIAIRLLRGANSRLKKEDLGFFEDDLAALTNLFSSNSGAIIVTGPTGSGKSTTLNCFLSELNSDELNIVTIEDPVENPISGVNHVNVDSSADLTFTNTLPWTLRQDPDVIMVGEMRDEETASIAISAAITGHLVLSTLHTKDAAGVIERILDMNVEPYRLAAALRGIISQRLVRRLCKECRISTTLEPQHAAQFKVKPGAEIFRAEGCVACNSTGYKGRLALCEYVIIDTVATRRLSSHPTKFARELRDASTFNINAIRHVLAGNTTIEEILRVI